MRTLYLTNLLRKKLEKPLLGELIKGNISQVKNKFILFLKETKPKKVILVGDVVSQTLPGGIKIFDGKVQRNKKVKSLLPYELNLWNPPASIFKKTWQVLKKALREKKNVFIEGEEDLLALPLILLAPENSLLVYGQKNVGICVIKIKKNTKKEVKEILKKFRKTKFKKIILGGTFDKLHPGHRYFLSMAKYYAKKAFLGLCSDEFTKKNKKFSSQIEPFEIRKKRLKEFFKKIKFEVEIKKIYDPFGPSISDKKADAILLTEETFKNGLKINQIRQKKGLKPLNLIILPYLLDKKGKKISSTSLRQKFLTSKHTLEI